jgi:mercuric ion transport protein
MRRRELASRDVGAKGAERGVAALGTVTSLGALFSAVACCVLPLCLAALGVGTGGLAMVVPFHWPLTIAAAVMVAVGWVLYARKRRACAVDPDCAIAPPSRATFVMLCVATIMVAISSLWPFIEPPLMRLAEGL